MVRTKTSAFSEEKYLFQQGHRWALGQYICHLYLRKISHF